MQTLLIYELLPEEVNLYLIPDAPDWITKVNGYYINGGPAEEAEELLLRVGDAINRTLGYCMDPDDELATQWAQYAVEAPVVIEGPVQVVKCGFIL